MKAIRGGMGIGDALYVQAVARHLIQRDDQPLKVCTSWPDVFKPLGRKVMTAPFTRSGIDILAHYSRRKHYRTDQFEDCCIEAGIVEPVDLRIDWAVEDTELTARLIEAAKGRPIVCVQLPRAPMGRTDGFGHELLPDCRVIQRAIDRLKGRALLVQIGTGRPLFNFSGIDANLADQTSVSQLLDVATVASGFLGYVSFIVPLAESLSKPALLVWSRRGLKSTTGYIRQITPQKVLHRPSCKFMVDDCRPDDAAQVESEFAHALGLSS